MTLIFSVLFIEHINNLDFFPAELMQPGGDFIKQCHLSLDWPRLSSGMGLRSVNTSFSCTLQIKSGICWLHIYKQVCRMANGPTGERRTTMGAGNYGKIESFYTCMGATDDEHSTSIQTRGLLADQLILPLHKIVTSCFKRQI